MLVDDLTLIKPLGKGAFGEVFLTSKLGSIQKFATKRINKKYAANPKAKKYLDREITILKELNHENIIKLYEVKETSNNFYLVTEYCNGRNLEEYFEKYQEEHNSPFPEELVQYLMRQIISAMKYLHDKRIIHRDIRLENIVIHYDSEEDRKKMNLIKAKVKIIDFGFSRYLKKGELAYSFLGGRIYMDPFIFMEQNKFKGFKKIGYDEKVDIWSLGILFYEMITGKYDFYEEDMDEIGSKVEKGNYFLPSTLSMEATSFLNGMLKYYPKNRLSAEQLYRHQFLNKNIKDFHKIELNKIKEYVVGSNIKMNIKLNLTIWDFYNTEYENNFYLKEKKKKLKQKIKTIMGSALKMI